jgi:hypothetical protein
MSGITAIARLAFLVLAWGASAALAQTAPQGESNTAFAKKFSNPIASLISAPFQVNHRPQWGGWLTITLLIPT